jgi:hypothetical protein
MSTTTTSTGTSYVQWLVESRPPASPGRDRRLPNQYLVDREPDVAEAAAPDDRDVRVSA